MAPLTKAAANMTLHAFNQRILAEDLVRVRRADDLERYAASQRHARIDPNPHQIDAVIFALRRLREGGCILADEVGLGKTIEAGLVIAQTRAEGAHRILLIVPKSLIGQWQNELANLFGIQAQDEQRSFVAPGVYLVGREFGGSERGAAALGAAPPFDLVAIDEAHEIFSGLHKRYGRDGVYDETSVANELAAARGALDVGFVVTVSPTKPLQLRIRKDGAPVESTSATQPLEIEATADVELDIAKVATVRIRGGGRDAQEKARVLEERWKQDIVPHLAAAGVKDLDGLDAKVVEAQELDVSTKAKDTELNSLRAQISPLTGAAEMFRQASDRAETCRAALVDGVPDTVSADLDALGVDPLAALRKRRQQLLKNIETARTIAADAVKAHTVAQERTSNFRLAFDAAVSKRDAALASFPEGLHAALATAQATLAAAIIEKQSVAGESESLESTIAVRNKLIEDAVRGARTKAEIARAAVEAAQEKLTAAIASHAQHGGRLVELLRLRDAEDSAAAETRLRDATERHAALPVPDRDVTKDEVNAAKKIEAGVRVELDAIERELQRAHGALEQVGGAVARERLRDATEAFELAERQERDIEADYEAWKLLLDQMKQADASQASNLGQALAPAIAGRFQVLTQRRYDAVQLSAQLGTEGVVVGGAARPASRLSVGTREQLSTLYRLSLAEYLQTTLVLDDQLVQSDDSRMDWFRALLNEKAHIFQIIVFTCRPGDYLAETSMVPNGPRIHEDTANGFIRAIDLGRALGQHRQSVT